ncbi:MAG: integration host factor subunit beta [Deltaproteobacteria bacterium]|nr:integration host factor subunit beta [Deltaproteobacteria bacterium]
MNKSEIIKALADECSLPAEESTMIVNLFFDNMKQALTGNNRVEIRGLGSFKLKNYEGYVGRNPKTGKSVTVAPKKLPFFRAGKELKEYINN